MKSSESLGAILRKARSEREAERKREAEFSAYLRHVHRLALNLANKTP
jgi:hypothetical protein